MVFRGDSALHIATKIGNMTAVNTLLKANECQDPTVDVNKCDNSGFTAAFYAIKSNR